MSLTPNQTTGVKTFGKPLLLCAGAGAGKTKVIVEKIRLILSSGTDPQSVAAITFTKKAAAEMKERLYSMIGLDAYRCVITNWHSFALNHILKPANKRNHPFFAFQRYKGELIVIDKGESVSLLRESAKDELSKEEHEFWDERGGLRSLDKVMAKGRANGRTVKEHYEWQQKIWVTEGCDKQASQQFTYNIRIWRNYERRLRNVNATDFDNILVLSVKLLQYDPNLVRLLQAQFKYVLADEHQDCNPVQGLLLKLIVGNGTGLTIVGDEKQSIYGFREADVYQLLDAHRQYPGMEIVNMADNFRSKSPIISLANNIASLMEEKITDGQMIPYRRDRGIKPQLRVFQTDRDEADHVANEIISKISSGTKASDIAVLYRGKIAKECLEKTLIEKQVPIQVVGEQDFFDKAEVKDWVAFLRFCANPNDVMAASRTVEAMDIGSRGLTLRRHVMDHGISVEDYLIEQSRKGGPKSAGKRAGFANLIELYQAFNSTFLEAGSRETFADSQGITFAESEELWNEYLNKIYNALMGSWIELYQPAVVRAAEKKVAKSGSDDEGNNVASIVATKKRNVELLTQRFFKFLETQGHMIDAVKEIVLLLDSGETNTDAVQFMTEHASKGLEFSVVYVIGCEDETSFRDGDNQENSWHEELRLLYVAATRPMDELYISCATSRWEFTDTKVKTPLRFLERLNPENIDIITYNGKPLSFFSKQQQAVPRWSNSHQRNKSPSQEDRIAGFKIN
ncbi:ATP-dependent helicase [Vibrio navarrensis]|nr:ATP-dependent helicase [Vibrio navarrensis]HDY8121289.1 ATP-dependent helicase [Vibrio vulnificus]